MTNYRNKARIKIHQGALDIALEDLKIAVSKYHDWNHRAQAIKKIMDYHALFLPTKGINN